MEEDAALPHVAVEVARERGGRRKQNEARRHGHGQHREADVRQVLVAPDAQQRQGHENERQREQRLERAEIVEPRRQPAEQRHGQREPRAERRELERRGDRCFARPALDQPERRSVAPHDPTRKT